MKKIRRRKHTRTRAKKPAPSAGDLHVVKLVVKRSHHRMKQVAVPALVPAQFVKTLADEPVHVEVVGPLLAAWRFVKRFF